MKFERTVKCQEGFDKMKQFLTIAPILKITHLSKEFIVCTNTSLEGLGGVLMQYHNVVITYSTRKLKVHEKNYALYDLELATMVHGLQKWIIIY